ncbi:MAG: FdtA/QdtA family cupin domain-containing protein [Flavobacterium circumlabens]|uniref:WxcM-like domain-containing protein n=1 Tax=Flavobacterium circumlabens TaxID=2133765 RepID=A0A4Y7UCQ9_9FLAO|nr:MULTISPECIES: FdtA/QdtA family cupin domain-containing protein [Flavobacterium]QSB26173.1 WxcM-like domain-containing protein [Flavobacterium sp. CLA17]TCN57475.1 dTDP-4-dehydrorhamnose 3,5-epimerase-like enzyme [Flavobacterium circumlabens]TEB43788.1 WxcM-like domain-containing protein [Flavobacterium circumlabens]
MTTNTDIQLIEIPKIQDRRGNLSVIEGDTIPFASKRVYYLYDVPGGSKRGGHAHKKQQEFLIALSGSFDVVLKDGKSSQTVTLNRPSLGLLIVDGIWRELQNFSSGAVCLVLASDEFDEEDYIREYKNFKLFKNR